jgi:uncharacterized protein YyaL (SSP411 family)
VTDTNSHRNRLADETSPYLLQHAANPVDWYPWGPEALERARREDKPILLSIGYAACHWCHVMAHESFEDEATAQVMNELFVNIKLDREERPDLDKIYQSAYQLLNRRAGGWPLTVFMTPDDHAPFFIATYVPKTARHGMPAFTRLLRQVAQVYRERHEDVREQNRSLLAALQRTPAEADSAPGPQPLADCREQLGRIHDPVHGGFGDAPKFPHPTHIERLLRHWQRMGDDPEALEMAAETLRRMARGGIYDQLGGGFCRYSVDERWEIPHFEKMLYDNGPLLALYAEAHAVTGEALFRRVIEETADWLLDEMRSPEGAFYASLDADSEGEEGRFYVWDRDDIRAALSDAEYAMFAPCYGLDQPANFEGRWHLRLAETPERLAIRLGLDPNEVRRKCDSARARLLAIRAERERPGRDDKILTAWNALAIRGLAVAGRFLERGDWLEAAERALDDVSERLWRGGRLYASVRDSRPGSGGFLDDYAFLLDAILALLEARWRDGDMRFAVRLADALLAHFRDSAGGFFFTPDDHEPLIQRPKPALDDALPSGNGIAALALLRLGRLLGRADYLDAAERTLAWARPWLEQTPLGCATLLHALEDFLLPDTTVVLRGRDVDRDPWLAVGGAAYAPRRLLLAIPEDASDLPGQLAMLVTGPQGETRAYACHGTHCSAPVATPDELGVLLAGRRVAGNDLK